MDLIALTRTLVDIPSITGSEAAISKWLAEFLAGAGYQVRAQTVESERRNVLALGQDRPAVVFSTHMDTVGPFIPFSEDEEFIYGRGTCDAKGIIAAMITAAEELRAEGICSFGLLFLVGEETHSDGAKVADAISPGPRYIIMGEPTENILATSHKGILTVKISARGRRAHSCYPERGESAVEKLLDVLAAIREIAFGQDPVLGRATLNIGLLSGGSAPNVIPDSAEAVVSLRLVGSPDDALALLRGALLERADLEILSQSPPQRLLTLAGFRTAVMPFGTDIPHLKRYGTPLLIGPGSVHDAHHERERVAKAVLHEAVELYKNLGRRLLEEP
jgi:acetylornithine deacetylase